ncbi:beta strand repeat-containing protein [Deinococcus aquaedulcis]|uniref:beta strand repeat-containing protein n=1 Tax=Deinococcus aquaedulcis TaxID=2840455 RepID=UPI001C82A1A5|nr:DUF11 domain-containing protein [Deinococcus aquaedulcis]
MRRLLHLLAQLGRGTWSPLVTVLALLGLWSQAGALTGVTVTYNADTHLVSDSNKSCTAGPRNAYVSYRVTNTTGAAINNISATLSFGAATYATGATGTFGLGGGQPATQFVGTLAAGESRTVFWYITYPCYGGSARTSSVPITATFSDSNPGTVANTTTVSTFSSISANAGGLLNGTVLGPGAVVGQIIKYSVQYRFGNPQATDEVNLQPAGNDSFNAACFQLVGSNITASQVLSINPGTRDQLYFTLTQTTGGSSNTVDIDYFFQYKCAGTSTSASSYSVETSGSTNVKYSSNYGDPALGVITFPSATQALTISKSASPTALNGGGNVTYTVQVRNNSTFDTYLDRVNDVLPSTPGTATLNSTSVSITGTAGVVTSPASVPAAGSSGTVTFAGSPLKSFFIPANGVLTITYGVTIPNVGGTFTNSATGTVGNSTVYTTTSGTTPASASVTNTGPRPLNVSKAFSPATISPGASTTLTITVNNPNAVTASAISLTDNVVSSMGYAAGSTLTVTGNTCGGTATVNSGSLSLSGASLAANGTCTVTLTFTPSNPAYGTATNTIPVANVQATVSGTTVRSAADATATLTVAPRTPVVTKSFSPATVLPGGTTQLTINVSNPNNATTSALTLTDDIAGSTGISSLTITGVTSDTCRGSGTVTTTAGRYALSGGTLPAAGCSVVLTVQVPASAAAGTFTNTIQGSSVTGTVGGASFPTPANATANLTVSGPQGDLAISKTGAATVNQGSVLTYTIRVWNNGPSTMPNVLIQDTVPASLTGVSWTCVATGTATCASPSGNGSTISLNATLPPDTGSTTTADTNFVTLTVTGTATDAGTISNTATVAATGSSTDPTPGNNSSTAPTSIVAQLTCSNLYGTVGGDFSGGTANNGTEIRVIDETTNTIGALIARIPATSGGAAGYTATLAIKPDRSQLFVVRDADNRLMIFNVASNTWTEGPTLPAPNGRYIRMAITSTDVGYLMDGGGTFYRFSTTAPYTVSAAIALTTLPSTAPTLAGSGDFFADNQGNLYLLSSDSVGGYLDFWQIELPTNTLLYLGRLTDPDVVGTYGGFGATPNGLFGRGGQGRMINVDLASFTASPVGSTTAGGSTDLASCSYPSLTRSVAAPKTAAKVAGSTGSTVEPGDTLEYTIVLRNSGTVAAGNTQFQDQIPAGTTYVAGSTTLNGAAVADATGGVMPYTQAGQLVGSPGQPLGTLLVDQTPTVLTDREAVIRFRVRINTVNPPAQVSNQGTGAYRNNGTTVSVPTDDPGTTTPNDPTITYLRAADLSAAKSGPGFAKPGETYSYTITITNLTSGTGTNITVTDTLAAGLTFASASDGGTYNAATRTVTWTLASLGANATKTLTLGVTAPAATAISPTTGVKSVQNTATVSVTGDPNTANNTSAPVTTRFVLTEVAKRVRNVTTGGAFGTSGGGKPAEVLEYCLDARNLGGADLPNYVLTDQVPSNVNALLTAYDAEEPSTATGFGVKVTRGSTTSYRTSAADADTGTLTTTGGTFGRGTLTLTLGTLTAGETATACFQTTIR